MPQFSKLRLYAGLIVMLLVSSIALAESSSGKVTRLARSYRCLVCQNQNVADSDAAFAELIREEITHFVREDYSDAAIEEALIDKYGEKIAMKPAFDQRTWLLWLAPFAFLGLPLFHSLRRQGKC